MIKCCQLKYNILFFTRLPFKKYNITHETAIPYFKKTTKEISSIKDTTRRTTKTNNQKTNKSLRTALVKDEDHKAKLQ